MSIVEELVGILFVTPAPGLPLELKEFASVFDFFLLVFFFYHYSGGQLIDFKSTTCSRRKMGSGSGGGSGSGDNETKKRTIRLYVPIICVTDISRGSGRSNFVVKVGNEIGVVSNINGFFFLFFFKKTLLCPLWGEFSFSLGEELD